MKKKITYGTLALFACIGGAYLLNNLLVSAETSKEPAAAQAANAPSAGAGAEQQASGQAEAAKKSLDELIHLYGEMPMIDAHNHDAGAESLSAVKRMWDRLGVDRVVLFGDVSEPSAIRTDEVAFQAYQASPEKVIPFFSGVNLLEPSGIEAAKQRLEEGYFGIGEIAAASTASPVLSKVAWKTKHPMDGVLPQLYELCAEYKAPLLLHIDPPNGIAIEKLKEAIKAYPDTRFIFAHANAYNSPEKIRELLSSNPNVYADFFAGFTAFNPDSSHKLEDFVPVMKEFPDRFLLSSDSGYGLKSEEQAIEGMYLLLDALGDRELAEKVAYRNMDALIQDQPVTAAQMERIGKLDQAQGRPARDFSNMTKVQAGLILYGEQKPQQTKPSS
ncbi:amidohydrolase family protein [Paenibacillus turpanensis]|uniref:amidohydrolase family protein n=1 Tax=Paenibacillus turpanensis TaxID=2689078 RepID=UPI00140AEAEE|nr:amidohydrolase family protein [Paenibacillus turpanensis]